MRSRSFLLIGVVVLIGISALAQDPVVANSVNTGMPPNAILSGSEIDNVQINNGNLHVEIPISVTPGRGSKDLSTSSSWVYDSAGWQINLVGGGECVNYPCYYSIKEETNNYMSFVLVTNQSFVLSHSTFKQSCSGVQSNYLYNFVLREPDGTKHHFEPDPSDQTICTNNPTTRYAEDGSGFVLSILPGVNQFSVKRKDGTTVEGVGSTKDSNGNQISTTDTLGRTFPNAGSYWDTTGTVQNSTTTFQTVTLSTHLCGILNNPPDQICGERNYSRQALHTLTIPDGAAGLTYTVAFVNGDNGELSSITLPSGAQISYTWVTITNPVNGHSEQRVHTRTVTTNGVPAMWTYDYVYTYSERSTTVTDPLGNQTKYSCAIGQFGWSDNHGDPADIPCYINDVKYYSGSISDPNLLKDVATNFWSEPTPLPQLVTTTVYGPGGKTGPAFASALETDYDYVSTFAGDATWGNVTEKVEYSNNLSAPVRRTHYSYLHQSNSTYQSANLANLPTDVQTYDCSSGCTSHAPAHYSETWSGGTLVAETQTGYDDTGLSSSPTTAPGHDNTNYGLSYTVRGNPTTIKRCSGISSTCAAWAITTNVYDILGNLRTSTDPGDILGNHHTTVYDYSDNFAGSTGTCVPPPTPYTYAFLTKVTNAKGQFTTWSHYCTGEVNTFNDLNGQPTSYQFDQLKRLTQVTYADGGQTNFTYTDTFGAMSVARTVKFDSSHNIKNEAFFDGLGRTVKTKLTDPRDGDTFVDTTYDKLGRVSTVTNPYRGTPTDNPTAYQYDAIGRKTLEIPPDGTPVSTSYGVQTTAPAGLTTTVTDQAGHKRMTVTDGLGRLVEVWEPDPSSGALVNATQYTYDVLNNLTCAVQKGTDNTPFTTCSAASSTWRPRFAYYDPLSRLTTSNTPESGTTTWTYDPDSNVLTKTDARAAVINYNPAESPIDVLHRVTKKTYNNGDPSVSYYYDVSYNGLTDSYPIGHQTGMSDRTGMTAWDHDPMGRTKTEQRTINIPGLTPSAVTKSLTYIYNPDGSVQSITYPSGHRIDYAYYPAGQLYYEAGRPIQAIDSASGVNYVTNAIYAPHGDVATLTNGATGSFQGILTTNTWNSRFQPSTFTAATQGSGGHTVMSLSFNFNLGTQDNGLLVKINNNLQTTRSTNYAYDKLNRITGAWHDGTDWGTTYTLDIWANLSIKAPCTVGICGATKSTNDSLSVTVNQYNYFVGYPYDAVGNMTRDTLGYTYVYDAENRPYSAGGVTYYYDGEGERVAKSNGKLYFFGTGSAPLVETDVNGNYTAEYIFFNGRRVAMRKPDGSVHYYFADQIGSANVVTNADGSITEQDIEYHPYGEQYVYTDTLGQEYRFTGKEHDPESGNDYFGARYYSNQMGRFLTPDWAATPVPIPYAKLGDPQSLNLYSYVENNPITGIDPDGHCPWCVGALVGAGAGALSSAIAQKIANPDKPINWKKVGYAAVGGAIAGATFGALAAPATLTSIATGETVAISTAGAGETVAAGAAGGMTGGIAERTAESGSIGTATSDPTEIAKDAAFGAAGEAGGRAAGSLVRKAAGSELRQAEAQLARLTPKATARKARLANEAVKAAEKKLETKSSVVETAISAASDTGARVMTEKKK